MKLKDLPVRPEAVEVDGRKTLRIDPMVRSLLFQNDFSNFIIGLVLAALVLMFPFGSLLRSDRMSWMSAFIIGAPVLIIGGLLFTWLMAKGDTDRKAFYFQVADDTVKYWWKGRESKALTNPIEPFFIQFKLKSTKIAETSGMRISYEHGTVFKTTCLTSKDIEIIRNYLKLGNVRRT